MPLFDLLKTWWTQDSKVFTYEPLDANRVDVTSDYVALAAGRHYVRLWLAQMFLKTQAQLGQTWFPVVHSVVKFQFGTVTVELPNVADGTKVGRGDGKGALIARNFLLTPLVPFNGGTIEINAGLAGIQGQNYVQDFLKVLGDFSTLVAVPQISSVLNVAGPLATGVQSLFGKGGSHLSFFNGMSGGALGGYFSAIRAPHGEVDTKRLCVKDSTLHIGNGAAGSVPFDTHDHMLFRLQVIEERDDWDNLTMITDPMKKAAEALQGAREEEANSYLRAAIVAVHQAAELTIADRARVKIKLRDDFQVLKKDLGFSGLVAGDGYSLGKSMRRAIKPQQALSQPELSIDALLSEN